MSSTDAARAPYPKLVTVPGVVSPAAYVGTWTEGFSATDLLGYARVYSSGAQSESISWDVQLAAGPWSLDLIHIRDTDSGIYTVALDGVTVGTIDGYAATSGVRKSTVYGIPVPTAGNHRITLTMSTKNASSSSYIGRIAQLAFTKPDIPVYTMTNPLTAITWAAAFWASDPLWTPPASGAAVSSWRDGSGNGLDATNTGGNRPTYVVHDPLLNNRPAVSFVAGSSQSLATASFAQAQTFSVVMILSGASAIAGSRVFGGITTNLVQIYSTNGAWTAYAGSVVSVDTQPSTGTILTVVAAGAASKIITGPTSYSSQNIGASAIAGGIRIGAKGDGTSNFSTCKVAFCGVYAGDITADAAWADFKAWARANYGVTSA